MTMARHLRWNNRLDKACPARRGRPEPALPVLSPELVEGSKDAVPMDPATTKDGFVIVLKGEYGITNVFGD